MSRTTAQIIFFAYLGWGVLLQGCSSLPPAQSAGSAPVVQSFAPRSSPGNEIAMRAISLLGSPYKWGGSGPRQFDCSGLVRFVFGEIGVDVPRTAAEQYSAARHVDLDELAPGDLLFFRISGRRVSHVAIYAGEGRFIHAPQTGRPVELRTLDDEFYRPRLVGAGRFP
ncbi:MAG TPA: C40 family peptidase [Steroidobacteraceae bacterium]|nr:C40 family peptidase [Steroidobacteraceae bacterium]